VVIHIDSSVRGAYPLSEQQTRNLLRFCQSAGAELFSVTFLYVKGEQSETAADNFFQRLDPFMAGKHLVEKILGDGYEPRECWRLDEKSIEAILTETQGDLLAYNILHLPDDWLFYRGDTILLQVVSHEQELTLRLTDDQYAEFQRLGIPHKLGNPRWSGGLPDPALPKSPTR